MEQIESNLAEVVGYLSCEIGERSYLQEEKLERAAMYIEGKFRSYGYPVRRQPFQYRGRKYFNVIAENPDNDDSSEEVIVIGAHYDTVAGTPGADDNASGVAALLELARLTASGPLGRKVFFAAFSLEEPPFFMARFMGSYVYAEELKARAKKVIGMISLEMLGYYNDTKGSQLYPSSLFRFFYPDNGGFISFVGNYASRSFTRKMRDCFRSVSPVQAESLNGPSFIPGVDFSDHRNFWKFGYPAFMLTDTAFYRNPYYHEPGDTADTLNYRRMSEVVLGLYKALGKYTERGS